ncbi:TetR/AcrR family transcriptional regulator [Spongisporangium articulatum]|uniref:TetR/AcrR family transcriptional regulator n=1 Tax=Spongisporangium articulatum TaxID=3362603 RepID=A0ABW8AGG0_9ACTN
MVTRTAAKAQAKERLSREAVASAALALADAEGIDALTIRRLATDLGVTPMALYWHFKDKDALLDGIAEAVLLEVRLPDDDPTGPWDARLGALLDALLTPLAAHPAVAELLKKRVLLSEPGREITERALTLLRAGGFDAERASQLAVYALLFMTSMVTGMPGLSFGTDEEAREQEMRTKWAALQALPPKKYPHIIESAGPLTDCAATDEWLGFGMRTLMAGIRGQAPA